MTSKTLMLYNGKLSNEQTEFACVSFSADKIEQDNDTVQFFDKDGKVAAALILRNGAKIREL